MKSFESEISTNGDNQPGLYVRRVSKNNKAISLNIYKTRQTTYKKDCYLLKRSVISFDFS